MSTPQPTPSTSSSAAPQPSGGKRLNYRQQLAETYKNALPLVPPPPPSLPPSSNLPPTVLAALAQTYFSKKDLKGKSVRAIELENPRCVGIWDSFTGSVWVKGKRDGEILWTRGNFGKGSLSRSEPSWWKRTVRELTGSGNVLSSEEITALRRQERKDFKIARAAAAVATVEAQERALLASQALAAASSSSSSSATTIAPDEVIMPKRPGNAIYQVPVSDKTDAQLNAQEEEKRKRKIEEETVDLEHMQLTPEEVWFLAWGLDCLVVLDAKTKTPLPLPTLFHLLTCPILTPTPSLTLLQPSFPAPRPDNPFLVNYAVYHHYRSLGWVVKPGIKFCVDWLLYKRGVVFSHAEFAVCVIPTYSNPSDYETSPHREELANVERMNWAWFSTINRVNSQVKKTLVLCYVTIPSCSDEEPSFCGGDPESWSRFEIREVVLRRFVPSRMRD